jgi:hypothetical protein
MKKGKVVLSGVVVGVVVSIHSLQIITIPLRLSILDRQFVWKRHILLGYENNKRRLCSGPRCEKIINGSLL